MSYSFERIFTLEARTNDLLGLITDYFQLTSAQVFNEIWTLSRHLRAGLSRKGVDYAALKNALVPRTDRHERAYVFDYMQVGDNSYGKRIVETLLPALEERSTNSFLCGDWLYSYDPNGWYLEDLWKRLVPSIGKAEPRPWIAIYYLNNLTRRVAARLATAAATIPGYLGYLDLDFACPAKFALANMLVRAFVKHEQTIISPCPDEDFSSRNENMLGYAFVDLGFSLRSIPDLYYGLFLSYKIERPTSDTLEQDSRFCLNALSPSVLPLSSLEVVVEPAKLEYLRRAKCGSLRRAAIEGASNEMLAAAIRKKVLDNYIYNLSRSNVGDTLKFNIILEFAGKAKVLCALAYLPNEEKVRLITLY